MERRQFLSTTLGASLLAAPARSQETPVTGSTPQFYVWLEYTLRNGPQQKRMGDFLRDALIPALNRLGSTPVGVFEVLVGGHQPSLSVLIPFPTIEAVVSHEAELGRDQEFLKAGDAYLNGPATDAAYVRRETSLLHAFPNVPRIEVPAAAAAKGPRMFELRMYESHGEMASRKKMSMFTELGELEIFRKTGLTPVFFARTLVGQRQPNFVYMLTHETMAAREQHWDAFRTNPDWKKLSSTPGYSDAETVNNITTTFLRPAASSQI